VVLTQAVINEAGLTELPYVLQPTDPVLTLAALEALGTWRFRPATLDGKPVRVYFILTVNFRCK
jgi:hypothetical protein